MSEGLGIGQTLREAREDQGQSIDDLARATKIRADYLQALEAEQFQRMGGDVYAKGFLKTYATALGLDAEALLTTYRRRVQSSSQQLQGSLAKAPVAREPRGAPPVWLAWAIVGVIVLMGAVALANIVGGTSPEPAEQDPPPVAATPTPTPTPSVTVEPTPTPTFEGVNLRLVFESDCYVRIEVDGQTVEETTIRAGDERIFQGDEVVFTRLGNAGGVRVFLNGVDQGLAGDPGEVKNITWTEDGPA